MLCNVDLHLHQPVCLSATQEVDVKEKKGMARLTWDLNLFSVFWGNEGRTKKEKLEKKRFLYVFFCGAIGEFYFGFIIECFCVD